MQQTFESLEQRLSQISIDLLNRMAEIQTLREAIRSAEAAQRSPGHEQINPAIIAPPAGNELRV